MMRLSRVAATLALCCPIALSAQDEEPPNVLSISSWQCPQSAISDISDNYDATTRLIEDELVAEGSMVSAGMFFHAWADEYNVNYYRVAPSMSGLFDAVAEVARRFSERHPELADQDPFASCTAHRDNIYFMGPSTQAEPPGGD